MDKIRALLEVYSIEEIIEYNDLEVADIVLYLVKEYGLKIPEVEPCYGKHRDED